MISSGDKVVVIKVVHVSKAVIKSYTIVVYARLDLPEAGAGPLSRSFLNDTLAQRGLF